MYLLEGILGPPPKKHLLKVWRNRIISQILGSKINPFTGRQNQKHKMFSSCPLWPWIDIILGNLHPQEALAQRIWQHAQYKCRFWHKSGRRTYLRLLSFGIIMNTHAKVNFKLWAKKKKKKLFEWLKAFWMIRPVENFLFRWGLKELNYSFDSIVLLIIGTQTLVKRVFLWVTSRFSFIPTVMSLKGQVKICVLQDVLKSWGKLNLAM